MPQRAERGRKVQHRVHDMNRAVLLLWQALLLLPCSPHRSALCLSLLFHALVWFFFFLPHTLSLVVSEEISPQVRDTWFLRFYMGSDRRGTLSVASLSLCDRVELSKHGLHLEALIVFPLFIYHLASEPQPPTWPSDALSLSSRSRPSDTLSRERLWSQEELPLSWFPILALAYALMFPCCVATGARLRAGWPKLDWRAAGEVSGCEGGGMGLSAGERDRDWKRAREWTSWIKISALVVRQWGQSSGAVSARR